MLHCGLLCVGGILLAGCVGTKTTPAILSSNELLVPLSAFLTKDNHWKKYIVAENQKLKYPVCVFRLSDTEFSAVWMRCTHQGTELQVFGDKLQCPAHGSEFSDTGNVLNGPADKNLRTFPVSLRQDQLHISLQ